VRQAVFTVAERQCAAQRVSAVAVEVCVACVVRRGGRNARSIQQRRSGVASRKVREKKKKVQQQVAERVTVRRWQRVRQARQRAVVKQQRAENRGGAGVFCAKEKGVRRRRSESMREVKRA